jgi:hypothetical protein
MPYVASTMVWPNIRDDKPGLAKYLWKRLLEMCDDKHDFTLNIAEFLPNIYDNHHEGFKKIILLVTAGIVVRLLNDGRAAMTEQEATILGTALGNLLEHTKLNENYGWLIAETGDYQAIGYVMMMYLGRINDIIQEKQRGQMQQGMVPPTMDQQRQQQAAQSNGHQPQHAGANMPFSGSTKSGIPWMGGQS